MKRSHSVPSFLSLSDAPSILCMPWRILFLKVFRKIFKPPLFASISWVVFGGFSLCQPNPAPSAPKVFAKLSPQELKASLKVIGSRTYAYFGFNNPEIQLHLPMVLNSSYVNLTMKPPQLLDSGGLDVPYELERGLHELDTQIMEIRFLAPDGNSPAEFARALGEITGSFPLEMETRTHILPNTDSAIRIKGNTVEIVSSLVPKLPDFIEVVPVRAYDKAGNPLKKNYMTNTLEDDNETWEVFEFEGSISRVEIDTVVKMADLFIRYDVPIAPKLPAQRQAQAPEDERAVTMNPNTKLEITIRELDAPKAKAKAATETKIRETDKPETPTSVAKPKGKPVPIPANESLSSEAQSIGKAIEALRAAIPPPLKLVQAMVLGPNSVSMSVESGSTVLEWSCSSGTISGPVTVDTQWLQCKKGMPESALNLKRIPALFDHAMTQVNSREPPLQMVVGQGPCGTASVYISFPNKAWVYYEGDGILAKTSEVP